ncbi:hypothetical protein, unlikely [Trypanosoma congolense IL3000]|uniref:Uncharacterized protein n=1 Tax=Trypanosoma congolense (strain IL3000) TaxID=1068625 RepID=F9WHR8_TRYCI|nr:hypothetical protein, unlikely [Trypanosoma congolense IL3000]
MCGCALMCVLRLFSLKLDRKKKPSKSRGEQIMFFLKKDNPQKKKGEQQQQRGGEERSDMEGKGVERKGGKSEISGCEGCGGVVVVEKRWGSVCVCVCVWGLPSPCVEYTKSGKLIAHTFVFVFVCMHAWRRADRSGLQPNQPPPRKKR